MRSEGRYPLDVEDLVPALEAERERRSHRKLHVRVEPFGVSRGKTRGANRALEYVHGIAVREEAGVARFLERDAVPREGAGRRRRAPDGRRQVGHRLLPVGRSFRDLPVRRGIFGRRYGRVERRERPRKRGREHGVFAVARHSAGVAVSPLAVLGPHFLLRLHELDFEEALRDGSVEHVPGQDLVDVVGPQPGGFRNPLRLERPLPQVVPEMLAPAVELHARKPGGVKDTRHAAVAPRQDALDLGLSRLVPLHPGAADTAEAVFQIAELLLEEVDAVERRPLKGGPRLRHERPDRDIHFLAAVLATLREDSLDEQDQLVQIFFRLGREPDHRVDLDEVPTAREGDVGRLDHVRVRERLVDDAAEPVRAGLRSERETGLSHLRDGVREAHRKRFGAE